MNGGWCTPACNWCAVLLHAGVHSTPSGVLCTQTMKTLPDVLRIWCAPATCKCVLPTSFLRVHCHPHSDSRSDISAYVMSHVRYTTYKIIACIERATVLRANIMRVACKYKASEGVFSYSRLTNWCLAPPLRLKLFEGKAFKKPQNSEL